MDDTIHSETFLHEGREYVLRVYEDHDIEEPWNHDDGHGVVSEWTVREKRPGERVLNVDNVDKGLKRYYDIEASTEIALKDNWGCSPEYMDSLRRTRGREPTRREIAAKAVEQDFDRLRAWCNDDWVWACIEVADCETGVTAHLGGLESDYPDYMRECAHDLAEDIYPEAVKLLLAGERVGAR